MSEDTETTTETTATEAETAVASMATTTTETTGRPDNVPEKFWDTESNSVRTDDVLKSYSELEVRFGSFTGAPDEYGFNMSEEMTAKFEEIGMEVDVKDDPLYGAALEFAKDAGMNQEGMDGLTKLYLMTRLAEHESGQEFKADQIKELGDRADQRLSNLSAWGEKNLSPELFQSLTDSLTSAAMVPVLEHLIASTRNAPVADESMKTAPAFSETELNKMQFEKDEHGNRKINTDPAFRAQYQKMMKEFHGDAENRIMVG